MSLCWDPLAWESERAGEKRGWVRRLCGSRSVGAPAGGGEDGVVDECHPGIRCVPGRCGPPTCSCDRAPLFFRPGSERPAVNVPAPLPGQHRLVWGGPKLENLEIWFPFQAKVDEWILCMHLDVQNG